MGGRLDEPRRKVAVDPIVKEEIVVALWAEAKSPKWDEKTVVIEIMFRGLVRRTHRKVALGADRRRVK
jgi:hypothetical protein